MASAGDPPAPETDDPYELLGVARDADEATVKKAYARLVRTFRPDKSPREFQRVHAAFVIVKTHGEARVPAAQPVVVEEAAPPPPPDASVARRVTEAGDTVAARCALIDAFLDERLPLDVIFAHEALRDAVVEHRSLTWSRLAAASTDVEAVHAVWQTVWRHAFDHDRERAVALLDDDRLRRDAGDYPPVALSYIDRLAALEWVYSFDDRRLLRRLREACTSPHPVVGHELDVLELVFAAASALRRYHWPAPIQKLVKLVIACRIDGQVRRAELARELVTSLAADLDATFQAFDELPKNDALSAFREIIVEALAQEYHRLDALPKERFEELTRVLVEAGASPLTWKIRGGVAAGAAALAVIGWVPSVVFAGGAAVYGLATETARYRRQIRPRLARAILAVPVASSVVHRWILLNRKLAGRLTRYTPGIDHDITLYMFSLLVCYAHAVT